MRPCVPLPGPMCLFRFGFRFVPSYGLTGIHDAGVSAEFIDLYKR